MLAPIPIVVAIIGSFSIAGNAVSLPSPRPLPRQELVRHEWQEVQHVNGWQRRERLSKLGDANNGTAAIGLPMRIGFTQSNAVIQEAHRLLMDRSDPTSPLYGQHMTAEAVIDLFTPPDEAVEAVTRWVVESGNIAADRVSLSTNRQWLQFEAHVDEVEQLLQADYYSYEHIQSGIRVAACPEYHVPATLQKHIDYITPGVKLASLGFEDKVRALKRRRTTEEEDAAEPLQAKKTTKPNPPRRIRNAPSSTTTATRPPWVTGDCDRFATFECIRNQYGLPSLELPTANTSFKFTSTAAPVQGNELGIFQSLGMHYAQDDLDIFFSYAAPEIPAGTAPELRAVDGATGPAMGGKSAGPEANLDLEMAMPLVYPQKTVLWQVDDEWYEEAMGYPGFFNTFFDAIDGSYCTFSAFGETGDCKDPACRDPVYPNPHSSSSTGSYQGPRMCGTFRPTNVITISYSNVEQALPAAYLQRQCLEVLKLGLQGVTVVQSSGDNGVGGAPGSRGDPHMGCQGPNRTVFSPRSLADCPYVLSVGATVVKERPPTNSSAIVVIDKKSLENRNEEREAKSTFFEAAPISFSTGGGFSNIFAMPDWQQIAVQDYLAQASLGFIGYSGHTTGSGLFNKSGRGYPDVSAVGDNTYIIYRGLAVKMSGTSVAAPIWAAMLTLVNEARLRANKTTVGFVHLVLYQHPEVFTDIVDGSNPGCGSKGFVATPGWDPVTGLGTPIFPKLRDLFLGFP
ncbi:hypothetical protein SBRCBS47491_000179 [Sporothrix bragantina]|uniref:Peptidase S53 domain-containing protein n=1 Tax=Sporothrix bragantina TaxID=671064 RepID=A0ABP0AN71_9PEZI